MPKIEEENYIILLDKAKAEDTEDAYLQAYAALPARCEALVHLARKCNDTGQFHLAYLSAKIAQSLSKYSDALSLEDDCYDWKRQDELAIASFYIDKKEESAALNQALLHNPSLPAWQRQRIVENYQFSSDDIPAFAFAKDLFETCQIQEIPFVPRGDYVASNPSIHFDGTTWRCIVRTTNYQIVNGHYLTPDDNIIYTRNFMLDLSDDLQITRYTEMKDMTGGERTDFPVHGFEDCRLFTWQKRLWATATACDLPYPNGSKGRREIVLLGIGEDHHLHSATPLRGEWSRHPQKNWMPLVDHTASDEIEFLYAVEPSPVIFSYDADGIHGEDCGVGHFRGGSQAIPFDEGWIFIVHEVLFHKTGRIYLHRFMTMDKNKKKITGESDSFYFRRVGIEFCAGLGFDGKKLVASFSVEDREAHLAVFDLNDVLLQMRPR